MAGVAATPSCAGPRKINEEHVDFSEFFLATESPTNTSTISVCTPPNVEPDHDLVIAGVGGGAADLTIFRVDGNERTGLKRVWSKANVEIPLTLANVASVNVPRSWASGLYLVRAHNARKATGFAWHPFVVTNWAVTSPLVVQVPTFTYQAYNAWNGASLYSFNSSGARAESVGLRRPFDVFDGCGFSFYGDLPFAWWLSRQGIDALWVTSEQTHLQPDLMDNRSLFVSVFHDEYWTPQMRTNLEQAVANGAHAAFLGANNIYWQVELEGLEPHSSGEPRLHCAKDKTGPQSRFRDVGRPEANLLGSQYGHFRFPYGEAAADWIVASSTHWIYQGTGLHDGDRIERLIGYEWDRLPGTEVPPNVVKLADSEVMPTHPHHATMVSTPGGGTVFNAGTTYWPRFLAGGGHWQPNPMVHRMTRNLIDRLAFAA